MKRELIESWNKAQAIGFDIDLTLVDSTISQIMTYNQFIQRYRKDAFTEDSDIKKGFLVMPVKDCLNYLKKKFNLPDFDLDEAEKIYFSTILDNKKHDRVYEGVLEILNYVKEQDKRLFFITGAPEAEAMANIRKLESALGKEKFYDVLFTRDTIEYQKPSPRLMMEAIVELNEKGGYVFNYIFVGDNPNDMRLVMSYNRVSPIAEGTPVFLETNISFDKLDDSIKRKVGNNHFKSILELYNAIK